MFLTTGNIMGLLSKVVDWIESHPQTTELITAILVTLIAGGYITKILSIYLEPYFTVRKKRTEASTTFYPLLKHNILQLKDVLDSYKRLNCSPSDTKNIYKLQVKKECWYQNDTDRFIYPLDEELGLYKQYASEIKSLIEKSTVNVPPKSVNKNNWYNNQHTLLSFCDFIIAANKDGGNLDYDTGLKESIQNDCQRVNDMMKFYEKTL